VRIDLVREAVETVPFPAEPRLLVGRLQQIATLPLQVVDDAATVEATMQADGSRLMEMKPGCAAMKRARSAINDSASACLPGSGSTTVIWVTGWLSARM
jgi:hypothetical protein